MKRRILSKSERAEIRYKFGNCCAYCGEYLTKMHVDHVKPFDGTFCYVKQELQRGTCDFDNLYPSCPTCNNYKHKLSLEDFRKIIAESCRKARERSVNYRFAKRYGLIEETGRSVTFWFERCKSK